MSIDLDTPYSLSAADIARFSEEGFIKLKNVLSPDTIAHYGPEITRATIALNTQTKPLAERSTYDRAFLQVSNLWLENEAAREFVFSKRLARIAAQLLQVQGVRLYHDQALYKEPGGGITPAHCDQSYWPMSTDRTVTVWAPLQAVPKDMGPLAFYKGSHSVNFGRGMPISDESEAQITEAMEQRGFPFVDEPYELGEVSFHLGWTFHRAGPNRTPAPRSVMTVIYMDSAMTMGEPTNYMQASDAKRWCPGVEAGRLIDSPKNPVLI